MCGNFDGDGENDYNDANGINHAGESNRYNDITNSYHVGILDKDTLPPQPQPSETAPPTEKPPPT